MSGEDAPRPYLENLIVLEIKTNKHGTRKQKTRPIFPIHIGSRGDANKLPGRSVRMLFVPGSPGLQK
jgi:hypothetical protein